MISRTTMIIVKGVTNTKEKINKRLDRLILIHILGVEDSGFLDLNLRVKTKPLGILNVRYVAKLGCQPTQRSNLGKHVSIAINTSFLPICGLTIQKNIKKKIKY